MQIFTQTLAALFLVLGTTICNAQEPNGQFGMPGNSMMDVDGNSYKTVIMGEQVWMAENLRVVTFPDGTPIPFIEKKSHWKKLSASKPAYCYLHNDSTNASIYGALYTWAAAANGNTGSKHNPSEIQGICPEGWHLPSDAEWKEMEILIGIDKYQADGIKNRGSDEGSKIAGNHPLWNAGKLSLDADFGTTGFNGIPGSYRYDFGSFYSNGYFGSWWTATDFNPNFSWYRSISYAESGIYRQTLGKEFGLSVRCVKDK